MCAPPVATTPRLKCHAAKAPTKFVLAAWEVLGAHEEEDNILFGGWRLHRGGIGTKVCDERVQRIDEPRDGGESLDQAQLPLVVTDRRGIARLFSSRLLAVLHAPRTEGMSDRSTFAQAEHQPVQKREGGNGRWRGGVG